MRRAARFVLSFALIVSLAFTALSGWQLAAGWPATAFVDRGAGGIVAATDRAMARRATPQRLGERLQALLAERPRNWVAIDAVLAVAEERALSLAPPVLGAVETARGEDHGAAALARACLDCARDPRACGLSAEFACQVAVAVSPVGDVQGIAAELGNAARGEEIDRINLGLSVVGLASLLALVPSGGTSAVTAAGAKVLRLVYRMGRLSPRLVRLARRSVDEGIDWARLRNMPLGSVAEAGGLRRVINPAALAPLVDLGHDIGRMGAALGPRGAVLVLGRADDAVEARRLANASQALGARTVGRLEVLGTQRFLRATVRWSRLSWTLAASLGGFLLSLAGFLVGSAGNAGLRFLRRRAR